MSERAGRQASEGPSAVAAAATGALRQCAAFVSRVSAAEYARPSQVIAGSTLGQHVRHALDHFAAALAALDGAVVDYDHRERGTSIETDPEAALGLMRSLADLLSRVDAARGASVARVRVILSAAGDEQEFSSTLARELAFATHHAIHHHAMMVAIAHEQRLWTPEGFGRAPATLAHEASAPKAGLAGAAQGGWR